MPQFMTGISFLWVIVFFGVPGVFFGLKAWFGYRHLERDAAADWDYLVAENMQDLRLTKPAYMRAYQKVHAPRAALYLALAIATIGLITVPAFALINATLWGFWLLMEKSRDYEPGYLVWQFFIFFGLIALWVSVALLYARRYHRRAPGLLRDQLMRERAQFVPEAPFILSHENIHLWALNEDREKFKALFETGLGMAGTTEIKWSGSDFDCDIYSGEQGLVCVHIGTDLPKDLGGDAAWFSRETHPFLFPKQHARHDEAEMRYTIIRRKGGVHETFKAVQANGPSFEKASGGKEGRMCSLSHLNLDNEGCKIVLDVFLYEEGTQERPINPAP